MGLCMNALAWTLLVLLSLSSGSHEAASLSDQSVPDSLTPPEVLVIPPAIDYGASQAFVPVSQHIDIVNPSTTFPIQVHHVQSRSANFKVTEIQLTEIPPLSRVRVPVVFLPLGTGSFAGNVVVGTSKGEVHILVQGSAIPSEYKLKPFTEIVVPTDTLVTYAIELYNPHSQPFHVKEVFTTENFLNLAFSESSPLEASAWEIPPNKKSFIINISFRSQKTGIFSGFVHILTDRHFFIVPCEIKVIEDWIEILPPAVDFGSIMVSQKPSTQTVYLRNIGKQPLHLFAVRPAKPDPNLLIHFVQGMILLPSDKEIPAFTLSYSLAPNETDRSQFSGQVLLFTNQSNSRSSLEVPYSGKVLFGQLGFDDKELQFSLWKNESQHSRVSELERVLHVTNNFEEPIVLVSTDVDSEIFEITDISSGEVLQTGETAPLCTIKFSPSERTLDQTVDMVFVMNSSTLHIPLRVFSGCLSMSLLPSHSFKAEEGSVPEFVVHNYTEQDDYVQRAGIRFGSSMIGSVHTRVVQLRNYNPHSITVSQCRSTLSTVFASLALEPTKDGQRLSSEDGMEYGVLKNGDLVLPPNSLGRLKLSLFVDTLEEDPALLRGSGTITCPFSSKPSAIEFSYDYEGISGSVKVSPLGIEAGDVFPQGKKKQGKKKGFRAVHATNFFPKEITIVHTESSDPRVKFIVSQPLVKPKKKVRVGYIEFDLSGEHDYLASAQGEWNEADLLLLNNPLQQAESLALDKEIANSNREKLKKLRVAGQANIAAKLQIKFDIGEVADISVASSLVIPEIAPKNISFDFVLINQARTEAVIVTNPSVSPLMIQGVMMPEAGPFTFEAAGGMDSATIPPGKNVTLGYVHYRPEKIGEQVASFYVRNNLTRLSAVTLTGTGGKGQISFEVSSDLQTDIERRLVKKYEKQADVVGKGILVKESGLDAPVPVTKSPAGRVVLLQKAHDLVVNVSKFMNYIGVGLTEDGSIFQLGPIESSSVLPSKPIYVRNSGNLPIEITRIFIKYNKNELQDVCTGNVDNSSKLGLSLRGCTELPFSLEPNEARGFRLLWTPESLMQYGLLNEPDSFQSAVIMIAGHEGDAYELNLKVYAPGPLREVLLSVAPASLLQGIAKLCMVCFAAAVICMVALAVHRELQAWLDSPQSPNRAFERPSKTPRSVTAKSKQGPTKAAAVAVASSPGLASPAQKEQPKAQRAEVPKRAVQQASPAPSVSATPSKSKRKKGDSALKHPSTTSTISTASSAKQPAKQPTPSVSSPPTTSPSESSRSRSNSQPGRSRSNSNSNAQTGEGADNKDGFIVKTSRRGGKNKRREREKAATPQASFPPKEQKDREKAEQKQREQRAKEEQQKTVQEQQKKQQDRRKLEEQRRLDEQKRKEERDRAKQKQQLQQQPKLQQVTPTQQPKQRQKRQLQQMQSQPQPKPILKTSKSQHELLQEKIQRQQEQIQQLQHQAALQQQQQKLLYRHPNLSKQPQAQAQPPQHQVRTPLLPSVSAGHATPSASSVGAIGPSASTISAANVYLAQQRQKQLQKQKFQPAGRKDSSLARDSHLSQRPPPPQHQGRKKSCHHFEGWARQVQGNRGGRRPLFAHGPPQIECDIIL